jgi:hypothetical protein
MTLRLSEVSHFIRTSKYECSNRFCIENCVFRECYGCFEEKTGVATDFMAHIEDISINRPCSSGSKNAQKNLP